MSSEGVMPEGGRQGSAMGTVARASLFLIALVIVAVAEAIGNVAIPVGSSKIVLLPLLWALLMGAGLGLAARYLPPPLRLSTGMQNLAAAFLQPALLIFVAKLGLLVGGSIPKLLASGWSLAFQEFGHFLRHDGLRPARGAPARDQARGDRRDLLRRARAQPRHHRWRIVVVSLMANAGTFLGAALIAQFWMHPPV